jgi:hypothetical protein
LEPLSFSPPFLPHFVKFRPCFARFEPSDVYGAVPSATALVIAYRATGHLCLPVAYEYQPQIASQLIVVRVLVIVSTRYEPQMLLLDSVFVTPLIPLSVLL